MAVVGENKLLGKHSGDDTGATDAGAAYCLTRLPVSCFRLFSIRLPTLETVSARVQSPPRSDKVVIGAYLDDDAGAVDAGAVYVFDIVQTTTTDSLGNYSFTGLDAGAYTVAKSSSQGLPKHFPVAMARTS